MARAMGLDPGELRSALGDTVKARSLKAGEILFRQGDPTYGVFAVKSGRLRMVRHTANGSQVTVHVARAGESLAEPSLFSPAYHCDCVADTLSEVAVFPKDALMRAMAADAELALRMMARLANLVQSLRSRIEHRNIRSAKERVLRALMLLEPPQGGSFENPWHLEGLRLGNWPDPRDALPRHARPGSRGPDQSLRQVRDHSQAGWRRSEGNDAKIIARMTAIIWGRRPRSHDRHTHEGGPIMRKALFSGVMAGAMVVAAGIADAADNRELVKMPTMMQEHMLESMRDHLIALNEILGAVAAEKYDDASKVAEEHLGMSSFERHGASHMAAYMPKPMQDAGGSLHRAASRFAIAAKDADIERSYSSMKHLMGALSEMTSACNACHVSYRIH